MIGAGVIGLTSAYFLRSRGHEVIVVDRQPGAGLETSFANGALLTPSMSEPWNTPGCWRMLLSSLTSSEAPLQLRIKALPELLPWGIAFLRNSKTGTFARSTEGNLRLALYSLKVLRALRERTQLTYGSQICGTLRLFRDPKAFDNALTAANRLRKHGLCFHGLTKEATVDLEPALAPVAGEVAGAIHYKDDETGDAYRFCKGLADLARSEGVEFCFGVKAEAFNCRSGLVASLQTREGTLAADQYLVAAGSFSAPLLRPSGIRLPVQPAKGYSVTFDELPAGTAPRTPIVDDDMHAAVVPINGNVRVAGTAEFAGFDVSLRRERVQNLVNLARRILPQAALDVRSARAWCGLRAASSDGLPIISVTQVPNLWVNTGHNHLGWTMAAGSAQLLSDLVCGVTPSIDPSPYAFTTSR